MNEFLRNHGKPVPATRAEAEKLDVPPRNSDAQKALQNDLSLRASQLYEMIFASSGLEQHDLVQEFNALSPEDRGRNSRYSSGVTITPVSEGRIGEFEVKREKDGTISLAVPN